MKIRVVKGDITALEVDAIVNPANTHLVMGGGVAGAIKRKGGKEIEEEARKYAPIKIGEAVITSAGKLKAKYVIHSPTMKLDFKTDENKIALATKAAIEKAIEFNIKSLAFPAMGTGVGGIPFKIAAEIMKNEILKYKNNPNAPEEILIVLYSDDAYKDFLEVFKDVI